MLVSGAVAASAAPVARSAQANEHQSLRTGPVTSESEGHTASVIRVYRCSAPVEEMHLWVSVKQGGPDPTAEGSSATVDARYDTNISQDVAVTCNAKRHVAKDDLARHPTDFGRSPLGTRHNGPAQSRRTATSRYRFYQANSILGSFYEGAGVAYDWRGPAGER